MEIIEMEQGSMERTDAFVPPDVAENIGRLWFRGLIADNEEGDEPCGGIVWQYRDAEDEEKDTRAEIVWAAGKNREILEGLIASYDEQSASESTTYTEFEMPLTVRTPMLKDAFSENGFEIKKTESQDVYVTVEDLRKLKFKKKKPPFYIKTLGELNYRQFRNGIIDYLFQGRSGLLDDLAWLSIDWFEPEVSSCVVLDDKVKGFLLVHRTTTGILNVEVMFSIDIDPKRTVLELVRTSIWAAINKYPPETKIRLRRHNNSVHELVKKLFPDKKGDDVMAGSRRK